MTPPCRSASLVRYLAPADLCGGGEHSVFREAFPLGGASERRRIQRKEERRLNARLVTMAAVQLLNGDVQRWKSAELVEIITDQTQFESLSFLPAPGSSPPGTRR